MLHVVGLALSLIVCKPVQCFSVVAEHLDHESRASNFHMWSLRVHDNPPIAVVNYSCTQASFTFLSETPCVLTVTSCTVLNRIESVEVGAVSTINVLYALAYVMHSVQCAKLKIPYCLLPYLVLLNALDIRLRTQY